MKTKRNFSTIQITGQISFTGLWNCLSRPDISAAVTVITIKFASIRLINFERMLAMFPNLKDLRLYTVTLCPGHDTNEQSIQLPALPHLRKLFFGFGTDERLLQYISRARLATFTCREQSFTHIWDFLANQTDLKEIDFRRSSALVPFQIGSVTFSLKKVFFDFESMANIGILDLIFSQSYTIETMALDRISDPMTYTMALTPLTNITTLHIMPISVRNFPGSAFVLPKLTSVTELKIYDGVDYGYQRASIEELTIKFIECVPNLEILDLGVQYKLSYFEAIVESLSKLKIIKIVVSVHTKLKHLKYPPVEKLRIKSVAFGKFRTVYPPVSMVQTTAVYPTVSSLSYDGDINDDLLKVIQIMFPMLEQLDVLKTNLEAEHATSVAGLNIFYREKDFFV